MQALQSKIHLDSAIRFLHLIIMLSFLAAYLTGDSEDWHDWHMMFGYTLAISLGLRLMWQFLAPMLGVSQPFGLRKRLTIGKNFLQRVFKAPAHLILQASLQALSSGLFQASILLIFLVLPFTVIFGYATENTFNHMLKEIHEFLANLFLTAVLLHIASLLLNMGIQKKFWAKKMFWGQEFSGTALFSMALMLGGLMAFWYWYLS